MKSVAGTLKLDLAQFRELEAFATFGSELDAVSKAQLERGARLVELLKQPLHAPMAVEEQIVSIFAGTNGYLDDVPVNDVRRYEQELLEYFRTRHADIMDTIRRTGALPDGDAMATAVKDFTNSFLASSRDSAPADPSATDAASVGPEQSEETLRTE
jgi:F-type H+-transporting ATPase subunit alpha